MKLGTWCTDTDGRGRHRLSAAGSDSSRSAYAEIVDIGLGQWWWHLIIDGDHHDGPSNNAQKAIDHIEELIKQPALS